MVWQNLNGNNAIEAGVASAVDLAHATGSRAAIEISEGQVSCQRPGAFAG